MATRNVTLRAVVLIATSFAFTDRCLHAQQFADPAFRPYTLRSTEPKAIEGSLRRFLSERLSAGETIEIVSDARNGRLLVRGSTEVQQLASQFIQALDLPAQQSAVATNPSIEQVANTRGYFASSVEELARKEQAIRSLLAGQQDVRIASDERTRQLVVYASDAVHRQIGANWNNPAFFAQAAAAAPATNAIPHQKTQVQLENLNWQELLKSLRGIQGPNAAVTAPADGMLQVNMAGQNSQKTQLLIDQERQLVQITGPAPDTQQWSRVVQALDNQPTAENETQVTGRLDRADPATITHTISMLGASTSASRDSRVPPFTSSGPETIQAPVGQQRPMRLAQADGGGSTLTVPPGTFQQSGEGNAARMLMGGDSGSFLGPVAIEFIPGTEIFIVRGQKRDVDRVMRLIESIERLTSETKPTIEVIQLHHANSAALAELINQLNEDPLQARQGDISVTPLVKPNALLLIGRPNGVEAVREIIAKLDVEAEASDQFKVFKLNHLPSVDAERTINNIYGQTQQTGTTDGPVTLGPRVRAVADYRSNSVVVQASPRDLQEIAELLEEIDVEGSSTVSEVRVFRLKNAIAEEVAEVLNDTLQTRQSQQTQGNIGQQGGFGGTGAGGQVNTQAVSSPQAMTLVMKILDAEGNRLLDDETLSSGILANVIVASNERSNAVVVTAPKGSMDLIAEIVRQLDELPAQEAEIRVFNIVNGDANLLIEMLNTLFEQDQNQDGPLVQSAAGTGESTLVPLRFALDQRTNSIIASGNAADLRVVEAILLKLDASDVSRRRSRVVDLQIQNAQFVADAITNFVQQRRQAVLGIAQDTISQYELLDQEVVVVAEPNSNKLIVNATDRYFEDILQIIQELDRRPDMVKVQVLIAEVTLNSTEEMGVELGIQDSLLFNRSSLIDSVLTPGFNFNNQPLGNNASNPGSARDQVAGQALSDLGLARTNGELGFGGLVLSASNESVSVLLRALQESRRLDVLSRPQVMMLNNTEGRVLVGSVVPYVTGSTTQFGTVQNQVDFQQVGLVLQVTPRISPDGLIALQVVAERSNIGAIEDGIPISAADGVVLRAPIFNATRAETFVTAREGQTVILGGLITKERSAFERKVPYLGDIPFVGRLFRSDGISEQRTELLIILTPEIIRDEADIDRVNSEETARMSWCLGDVIEIHGDIGPGRRYYRDDVYSELAPGEVIVDEHDVQNGVYPMTEYPAEAGIEPQPYPHHAAPSSNSPQVAPPPTSASPPMPVLPHAPQANRARNNSVLKTSKNMSLFPFASPGLWNGDPPQESQSAGLTAKAARSASPAVRPVGFQADGPQQAVRTLGESPKPSKPSVFRFDEVPGE